MDIAFASSARSTLGIEWEIAIVDPTSGELVSAASRVLERIRSTGEAPHPNVTGELLLNTLELITGVHVTVADAMADLRAQMAAVRQITDDFGYDLICSGSHPFSHWYDQKITDEERYSKLIERTQWWGRNMMIWGIHVHVGIEDRAKVFPILNALLAYLPHLQALAASSPFWAGEQTGYASNRALMFQQLPTAGLPYSFADWHTYEGYAGDLVRTGIISDHTEVRWDIRPSPRWGTLEIRACDGVSSASEIASIAALTQCLVEWLSARLDAGETLPMMQPWFTRENKWRTARYGLEAEVIVDADGNERPVTDDLHDLVTTLAPVAEQLDCATELQGVRAITEHGASYHRQLQVAHASHGDLRAVVAHLAQELREGIAGA